MGYRFTLQVYVIVPVKALEKSKSRLSKLLTLNERVNLSIHMLRDVLTTLKKVNFRLRVIVVSCDQRIKGIAKDFSFSFLKEKTLKGLNSAIKEAIETYVRDEDSSVLIIPSDIPMIKPEDLEFLINQMERRCIVISPSKDWKGTNALLMNPPSAVPPLFGEESFKRHREKAFSRGLKVKTCYLPRVALDIDTEKDLQEFFSLRTDTYTQKYLSTNTLVKEKLEKRFNIHFRLLSEQPLFQKRAKDK